MHKLHEIIVTKAGPCMVLGCPIHWYGEGCSNRCSANCQDCNKVNGTCDFGCYAGWEGQFCEKGTQLSKPVDYLTKRCGLH